MGISAFKGKLAAAFTAALIAVSPVAQASTVAPENTQEQHITTTQFEVGQCYSDADIDRYLTMNGESEIMELDKTGTVNVRVNTPTGPQVMPRTFNNEYVLTADHDSWSIIEEKANGENCIIMQGTDLNYVSIDNKFFTQVNLQDVASQTDRDRLLGNIEQRFGVTSFLSGTLTDGRLVDITTSLQGQWGIAVSNADGSNARITMDGFDYSLIGPEFHDQFDIFHPDSTINASETMVQIKPEINNTPQI